MAAPPDATTLLGNTEALQAARWSRYIPALNRRTRGKVGPTDQDQTCQHLLH